MAKTKAPTKFQGKAKIFKARLEQQRAMLESELSAQLRSGRIQAQAVRQFGLEYQDPAQYGYVNLAK